MWKANLHPRFDMCLLGERLAGPRFGPKDEDAPGCACGNSKGFQNRSAFAEAADPFRRCSNTLGPSEPLTYS